MTVVEVHWVDIVVQNGWNKATDVMKDSPHRVVSYGVILHVDENKLVLAHGVGGDEVNPVTIIPRQCIIGINELIPAPASNEEPNGTGEPSEADDTSDDI